MLLVLLAIFLKVNGIARYISLCCYCLADVTIYDECLFRSSENTRKYSVTKVRGF